MSCIAQLPNTNDIRVYQRPPDPVEADANEPEPASLPDLEYPDDDSNLSDEDDDVAETPLLREPSTGGALYTLYLAFYNPSQKVRTEKTFVPQCLLLTPYLPDVKRMEKNSWRYYVHRPPRTGFKHKLVVERVPARLPSLELVVKLFSFSSVHMDEPAFRAFIALAKAENQQCISSNDIWLQNALDHLDTSFMLQGRLPVKDTGKKIFTMALKADIHQRRAWANHTRDWPPPPSRFLSVSTFRVREYRLMPEVCELGPLDDA